jgi:hypothetical protein
VLVTIVITFRLSSLSIFVSIRHERAVVLKQTGKSRALKKAERPDGIGVLFMAYATLAKFVINQRSNYEGWTMITRRQFLKASGLAGAGLLIP